MDRISGGQCGRSYLESSTSVFDPTTAGAIYTDFSNMQQLSTYVGHHTRYLSINEKVTLLSCALVTERCISRTIWRSGSLPLDIGMCQTSKLCSVLHQSLGVQFTRSTNPQPSHSLPQNLPVSLSSVETRLALRCLLFCDSSTRKLPSTAGSYDLLSSLQSYNDYLTSAH